MFVEWRLFLYGLLANMQETNFSRTGWPELCPVIFGCPGGFFLIMRRAGPISEDDFYSILGNEEAFEMWANTADYRVPVEFKPCSFGISNNKLVAVDYG